MNHQKSKPRRPPAEKMRKGIFGATALKQSPAVPRMLPGDFEGHCDGHGLDDNDAGQLLGQGKDDALKEVGMVAKETSRLPTLRIIKMD